MNSMIAIVITDSGVAHRHSTRVKELSSLHLKLCRGNSSEPRGLFWQRLYLQELTPQYGALPPPQNRMPRWRLCVVGTSR